MKKIITGTVLVLALSFILTACGPKKATLNVSATDKGYDMPTYTIPAGAETCFFKIRKKDETNELRWKRYTEILEKRALQRKK